MLFAGRAPDVAEHLLGRRLGPSGTSPGDQGGGFLAHLHFLAVTMSQKSSTSQPASAVSWALTPDTLGPAADTPQQVAATAFRLADRHIFGPSAYSDAAQSIVAPDARMIGVQVVSSSRTKRCASSMKSRPGAVAVSA